MNQSLEHTSVATNGIRLHCAVAGDGPLLLLLHGFPESWRGWHNQIPALAQHFKVVVPVLRGYGDSDKPSAGYDAVTLANDILGVIDKFGNGQPVRVVGHDWGGFIAWALSYLYPERLDRLTVLNSPHPYLYRTKIFTSQFFKSWYVGFFLLPWLPEQYLKCCGGYGIEKVFLRGAARPERLTREYLDAAKAEMLKDGAIRCGLEYYRTTVWAGKKNVSFMNSVTSVPTQIIWGEKDPALGKGLLDGVDKYAAHVRIDRLPESGHWVNHEDAESVNNLLLQWHLSNQPPVVG